MVPDGIEDARRHANQRTRQRARIERHISATWPATHHADQRRIDKLGHSPRRCGAAARTRHDDAERAVTERSPHRAPARNGSHVTPADQDGERASRDGGRARRGVPSPEVDDDRPGPACNGQQLRDSIRLGEPIGRQHRDRRPLRQPVDEYERIEAATAEKQPRPPRAGHTLETDQHVDATSDGIEIDQHAAPTEPRRNSEHRRERAGAHATTTAHDAEDRPHDLVHTSKPTDAAARRPRRKEICGQTTSLWTADLTRRR